MVSTAINVAMRGLQFLWTLLIMALVGHMIATANGGNPSIVNYDMFVAVIAMLSLFYLIPASIKESFAIMPLIMIIVDAVNTLFFFCGAVAMAAELGAHSCSNQKYTRSNHITNGADDREGRCRTAQATTAFLWFGFFAFAASTILSSISSRGSANLRPGGR